MWRFLFYIDEMVNAYSEIFTKNKENERFIKRN